MLLGASSPADRFSHEHCKGKTTDACVSWWVEHYQPDDRESQLIGNEILAELLVINPELFFKKMKPVPETLEAWLADLQMYTFRIVGPSIEAELERAAKQRLHDLVLEAAKEHATHPGHGEIARIIYDRVKNMRVEHVGAKRERRSN